MVGNDAVNRLDTLGLFYRIGEVFDFRYNMTYDQLFDDLLKKMRTSEKSTSTSRVTPGPSMTRTVFVNIMSAVPGMLYSYFIDRIGKIAQEKVTEMADAYIIGLSIAGAKTLDDECRGNSTAGLTVEEFTVVKKVTYNSILGLINVGGAISGMSASGLPGGFEVTIAPKSVRKTWRCVSKDTIFIGIQFSEKLTISGKLITRLCRQ